MLTRLRSRHISGSRNPPRLCSGCSLTLWPTLTPVAFQTCYRGLLFTKGREWFRCGGREVRHRLCNPVNVGSNPIRSPAAPINTFELAAPMYVTNSQIRNFKAKLLHLETGCIVWTGAKFPAGYGRMRIGSLKNGSRTIIKTHRLSYFLANGYLPDHLLVRHKCDVPACCNPEHLELGTHQDNMQDMKDRGRSRGNGMCNKGEHNPLAVLNENIVREIRKTPKTISNIALAEKYGVTHSNISAIRLGKTWQHII